MNVTSASGFFSFLLLSQAEKTTSSTLGFFHHLELFFYLRVSLSPMSTREKRTKEHIVSFGFLLHGDTQLTTHEPCDDSDISARRLEVRLEVRGRIGSARIAGWCSWQKPDALQRKEHKHGTILPRSPTARSLSNIGNVFLCAWSYLS